MGLRKRLFDAAEKFDSQLEHRVKRLPAKIKNVLCFALGLVVGEVRFKNKVLFFLLLGLGFIVTFSVVAFTRPKGRHNR